MRWIWIGLMLVYSYGASGQIIISEVVAFNETGITDFNENHVDWFELYNSSTRPINLKNYYFSDSREYPRKWKLTQRFVIDPGDYRIIYASGKDTIALGEVHTNFKLSHFGENLFISNGSGQMLDSINIPPLLEDESYGRIEDSSELFYFFSPTPRFKNLTSLIQPKTSVKIIQPMHVVVEDEHLVEWKTWGDCHKMSISVDGSIPAENMVDSTIELNIDDELHLFYSLIPTRYQYRLPDYHDRFHHVRVRCWDTSLRGYSEDHSTFVLGDLDEYHDLPVFFLDVAQGDLFDPESGMYVEGNDRNYSQNGDEWRRSARWMYSFDDQIQKGKVNVEIHGHATRALPQKSLKLTSIRSLDSTGLIGVKTDFDEGISEIILRSFHSDLIRNEFADFGFKDDLVMRLIMDQMKVYAQRSQFATVYINGEYWGIHSLRESSNESLIASRENIDRDQILIEKGGDHVFQLYRLIEDIAPDDEMALNRLSSYFDLENLVDYLLAELWFNNQDWPFNNIKTWRQRKSSGPYRFILFDMDACFKKPRQDPMTRFDIDNVPSRNNSDHYLFFQKLLSIDAFRTKLLTRFTELKGEVFDVGSMLAELEFMQRELEDEIINHTERWHYPSSRAVWEEAIEEIRDFILLRELHFNQSILDAQNLQLYPNPTTDYVILDFDIDLFDSYQWFGSTGQKLTDRLNLTSNKINIPVRGSTTAIYYLQLHGPLGYRTLAVQAGS